VLCSIFIIGVGTRRAVRHEGGGFEYHRSPLGSTPSSLGPTLRRSVLPLTVGFDSFVVGFYPLKATGPVTFVCHRSRRRCCRHRRRRRRRCFRCSSSPSLSPPPSFSSPSFRLIPRILPSSSSFSPSPHPRITRRMSKTNHDKCHGSSSATSPRRPSSSSSSTFLLPVDSPPSLGSPTRVVVVVAAIALVAAVVIVVRLLALRLRRVVRSSWQRACGRVPAHIPFWRGLLSVLCVPGC